MIFLRNDFEIINREGKLTEGSVSNNAAAGPVPRPKDISDAQNEYNEVINKFPSRVSYAGTTPAKSTIVSKIELRFFIQCLLYFIDRL